MKKIKASTINYYGNSTAIIRGANLKNMRANKIYDYVVIYCYNADFVKYNVLTDCKVVDVIRGVGTQDVGCHYEEKMRFETEPDKEDIAIEMI